MSDEPEKAKGGGWLRPHEGTHSEGGRGVSAGHATSVAMQDDVVLCKRRPCSVDTEVQTTKLASLVTGPARSSYEGERFFVARRSTQVCVELLRITIAEWERPNFRVLVVVCAEFTEEEESDARKDFALLDPVSTEITDEKDTKHAGYLLSKVGRHLLLMGRHAGIVMVRSDHWYHPIIVGMARDDHSPSIKELHYLNESEKRVSDSCWWVPQRRLLDPDRMS